MRGDDARRHVLDGHVAISGYGMGPECECGWEPERGQDGWPAHRQHVNDMLVAAGVAPHRPDGLVTLTEVEQLAALPEGAVIHSSGRSGHRTFERGGRDSWYEYEFGYDLRVPNHPDLLPAVLVWHPDWDQS